VVRHCSSPRSNPSGSVVSERVAPRRSPSSRVAWVRSAHRRSAFWRFAPRRLSWHRGRDPAKEFLTELKEKHRVSDEIRKTIAVRDSLDSETLDFQWAEVTAIEQTGSADRVCIDTGSLLDDAEGMLVGSMSRGLFFVHGETADSPYVESRPFRVNAGAVHAYVRSPGGETNYLSELTSGDQVQVVDVNGTTREAIVGRSKIEHRPMFRVQATVGEDRVETLLQNAETIKLHTRDGRKAVTDLETGDEVLVHYEEDARHFGEAVEESIIEK